jgi:diadenosine tetraphosphate (Ap4A) HIT family hydrolase
LAGKIEPPGGVVGENEHWIFFCGSRPLLVAGQGYIILRRHCEHLEEITPQEAATLGPMMRQVAQAVKSVLQPVKVHFGLYAESVKHIHFHVVPRMSYLPASNIRLTFLVGWYRILNRLGLKRPSGEEEVARIARQMRAEFQKLIQTEANLREMRWPLEELR